MTTPEVEATWADLGRRWYLHEQYFKAYPVCRWAQPAVEAVLSLREQIQDPADISHIEVATFHEAKRLHVVHPATTEQAQYSLPWSVAAALARGSLDAEAVTVLDAPDLRTLAARVEIHEDATFNARFPAERWALARLHLSDGRVLESAPCEALGNPHNPLPDEALTTKFHALADPVLGERAGPLREVILSLEDRPVGDLLTLLGPPGRE
ncbi:MmgE/PrpD family protein [Halomonas ventosae]|uniref:MmgE/PrpD family protein n=1 Tax=Halomonas ventosae TaxID=229007 RepID=A0A4R6ZL23_9GAMM|nr:MmgE/PrpD family protein [Halomonas ventosae]TDR52985.1 MmgE/PrpD family protein [Halomonas ventosae]